MKPACRRGFVLLTVLWLVVALGVATAVGLATVRRGLWTTRNRITLARGLWGGEACVAILAVRLATRPSLTVLDTTELGDGLWCTATIADPGGRLHLNHATERALRVVLSQDSLSDALLDWRDADDTPRPGGAEFSWYHAHQRAAPRNGDLADVAELRLVRGFEDVSRETLERWFTVRGTGAVNPSLAPEMILAGLPGFDSALAARLMSAREQGRRFASFDDLLLAVPPERREAVAGHALELQYALAFTPPELIAEISSGVRGQLAVSRIRLTLVPQAGRVAVTRRQLP